MSHGKQFTLYTHKGGPNGWKVAFFLSELGLTYESIYLDFDKKEQKSSPHIDLNPNGRIPTIIDHKNGDFVLWESNAILTYLADKYDPEHKFSASAEEDKYKQLQWLFFQSSGQGPYFGQAAWFTWYHPEKVPSAVERYQNEIKRVLGVLDGQLATREWLVGGKYSIADLSFISWTNVGVNALLQDYDLSKENPHVDAWLKKMLARPAIQKVYAEKDALAKQ
ncbi:glutathione S-transferase [Gloeophyllum trabeum ATCC 11539]|uniref:glutathione transferase n=1 Tax=Gloeophyllum trabeum (strain ATCC 11539 / FP-39264 / Madison 617) TaxID=670483 RepID=S7RFD0_GLOTA|nr:glutathione S-transferase [Gloeophyllum trabeum ATCC 11539]EPQ52910.1 glutathione S-transferase [Gloeophyllum trabeum ATCC 11539]